MVLFRRPRPRLVLWSVALLAIAVATGVAGLDWWLILLAEFAAWAVVTAVERMIWNRTLAPASEPAALPEPAAPAEPPRLAAVTAPAPEPEPEVVAASRKPEPARRRLPRAAARTNVASIRPQAPVRWNVWLLERVAREHPESEELGFLVVSLREFADAAGQLPADFDPLVRESFGSLLTV